MDDQQAGRNPAPVMPFADGPTDVMPLDWAEDIIRGLYAHHRAIFGELMLQRFGVDKLPRKRTGA
jgi:hypothetical protein